MSIPDQIIDSDLSRFFWFSHPHNTVTALLQVWSSSFHCRSCSAQCRHLGHICFSDLITNFSRRDDEYPIDDYDDDRKETRDHTSHILATPFATPAHLRSSPPISSTTPSPKEGPNHKVTDLTFPPNLPCFTPSPPSLTTHPFLLDGFATPACPTRATRADSPGLCDPRCAETICPSDVSWPLSPGSSH